MQSIVVRRWGACCTVLVLAALVGCATQPPGLYYWGDYQPEVYEYFKGTGESPEIQLGKLEATAQEANGARQPLPPGFNAHLGLLYLKTGQSARAQQAFYAEEAQFPESRQYIDFLLARFNPPKQQPMGGSN